MRMWKELVCVMLCVALVRSGFAQDSRKLCACSKGGSLKFWSGEGIILESQRKGVAYLTSSQPLTGDFCIETEVSHLHSHCGGHKFLILDSQSSMKFPLTHKDVTNWGMCCIYIVNSNASNPSRPNYFYIWYRNATGKTFTYSKETWKAGFHSSGIPWKSDKSYRLRIERNGNFMRFAIFSGNETLIETLPIETKIVRNGNGKCNFILGDGWTSYTYGSMVIKDISFNGQKINLKKTFPNLSLMKMVTEKIPYSGVFNLGNHKAFIQIPHEYSPDKKYPLIVFLHGRGGDVYGNNLLKEEFASFLRKVKEKGYIIVVPGYGSNSWMNKNGEKVVLDLIQFLNTKLSLDQKRLYLMGVSMGGGGALIFTMRHKEMVAGVCDIMGVTDFTRFYNEGSYHKSLIGAFGGSPQEKPEVYKEQSSLYHTAELKNTPILIIHGDKDRVVPFWNSELLYQKLKEEKGKVEFIKVPNGKHNNAIIIGLEDKVLNFFDGVLR